jgi:hypothetical protein
VEVSLFDGSAFWDGNSFSSRIELFFPAASTDGFATWSFPFTVPGTYTVHARATDAAGNVGETSTSVIVS